MLALASMPKWKSWLINKGETMHNQPLQIFKPSFVRIVVAAALILAALPGRVTAQQNNAAASPASAPTANSVPQIIQFSGQFSGQSSGTQGGSGVSASTVSITFTLFETEQGGTALWSETQNVQVDAQGHYTALLGSASPDGLPLNLFTTVQAHWLAVQPAGPEYAEQPRVLLVSAPYALKAGDAETIGGLPPSAFVRVDASSGTSGTIATTSAGTTSVATPASKGSAHRNPVQLDTQCGAFCNATTGFQINGQTVVSLPGGSGGNTALGVGALFTGGGGDNTATGATALGSTTTGADNTATGVQALEFTTSGIGNTATGLEALWKNTTGGANTASGNAALQNNTTGNNNTAIGDGALGVNTTASNNTASGYQALVSNTTGSPNTASGGYALYSNTTAGDNTASGFAALFSNTTGNLNTASGGYALYSNTTGIFNTATGYQALYHSNGSDNTASGVNALVTNTTGNNNTASGVQALEFNTTGSNNIAIGYNAATSVSSVNSNNIHIGSAGSSADNGAIRIGTKGTQKKFFVAGVSGISVGNAIPVMIDSITGQLGTVSSSRRYKEDIHDMGDSSEGLMRLRPVTFRYKQPFDDGSKPIQYGLIAEEVAAVYPDMVARSADGQIETVKYQLLDPMLLNEVQRQHAEAQRQQAKIQDLEGLVKTQQAQIAQLVSNVKTIQASLRTRRGSGHTRLASTKSTPVPARTDASLQAGSPTRGGN
jgi:hypothetical protein